MSTSFLRFMLWALTAVLCGLGLVMVASTTLGSLGAQGGLNLRFLIVQGCAMILGVAGAIALSLAGVERLRSGRVIGALAALTLVVMAATPFIGFSAGGATRWLRCGPISVQPAEFAKLAMVVVMSWYLVRVQERVRVTWNGVLLPFAGFAVLAILVLQTRDLGSVVIMAMALWTLLFFAGANWLYSTALGAGCLPIAFYVTVMQTAYRRDRILAFIDPWNAEGPAGYHLRQSFIAIGSGGWTGLGLGKGPSKDLFLPEKHTDFIYAVICEELGLAGALAVAGLYLLWVGVGLVVANRARDRFHRLLAVGVVVLIGLQAFWNMLVVTGTVPTKGLTLPFISYGGSSVVVCMLALGLLDAVARACPDPALPPLTGRLGASPIRTTRGARGVLA